MSENNYLDDILKERLSSYASETPTHLWQGVVAKRKGGAMALGWLQQKLGMWLLLIPLLLGGFIGGWIGFSSAQGEELVSIVGSGDVEQLADVLDNEQANLYAAVDEGQNNDLNSGTVEPKDVVASVGEQMLKQKEAEQASIPAMEDVLDASQGEQKIIEQKNSYTTSAELTNNEHFKTEAELTGSTTASQSVSNGSIAQNNLPSAPLARHWAPQSELNKLQIVGLGDVSLIDAYGPYTLAKRGHNEYHCNTINPGRQGNRFMMDVIFSPNYVMRSLKEREPEFAEFREHREQTESLKFSYTTGVRLHFNLFKGLTIGSGLLYTRGNEVFDYEGDDNRTFITTVIDTTFGAGGEVVSIDIDTVSVQQEGTRIVKHHNTYRFIDVPIFLGYTWPVHKKVNVSVLGGVLVNLSFKKRGRQLSPDTLEPISSELGTNGAPNIYKTQVGLSIYGAIGANYKITDKVHLIAEPWMRYNLKPLTLDSHPVEERYMNIGLNTGLRFVF